MTCFAIRACFDEANGISMVLGTYINIVQQVERRIPSHTLCHSDMVKPRAILITSCQHDLCLCALDGTQNKHKNVTINISEIYRYQIDVIEL
jgi:hypothetical protein